MASPTVHTLESNNFRIQIAARGAELQSVFDKRKNLEYLWQADPAFWGKHSPVLFPIVGTLKENRVQYQQNWYKMSRHGFARELDFQLELGDSTRAVWLLTDNEDTREHYPFRFEFRLIYQLKENGFSCAYQVTNPDQQDCWFSVGGHPAFRVPLDSNDSYNDYELVFNQRENAGRWPISAEGLIENRTEPVLENSNVLPISKSLFARDALVFKHLKSDAVSLRHKDGRIVWTLQFPGFPYLGLWAAKDADFLCVEPWCGIADPVDSKQQLTEKEGIIQLAPGSNWHRTWTFVAD